MQTTRKKLIEVTLPLEAINAASAHEKYPGIGAHPRSIHHWWARRPLAACRAVLFAQMVDDPSEHPELWPTEELQQAERERLFGLIEELVKWENINNTELLAKANAEMRRWVMEEGLPAVLDPFAGGGAIPLSAQQLGLEAHASDLNPVAVLINKAMIEIPPKWAGQPPVSEQQTLTTDHWPGATGLAADVRPPPPPIQMFYLNGLGPRAWLRMCDTMENGCGTRHTSASGISTPRPSCPMGQRQPSWPGGGRAR